MNAVQGINLLSPARRMARVRRQRISRWSAGLTAYGAILAAVWIAVQFGSSGADRTLAAELDAARSEIEEARQTIQALRPELVEARNVLAASRAVANQPDWSLLLSLLAGLLDEHTVLTEFHIQPAHGEPWDAGRARRANAEQTAHGPYRLQLSGFGRSQQAVQAYVLRLEQTDLFEDVRLMDTRAASFRDDEAIAFRVQCRLGEPLEPAAKQAADAGDADAQVEAHTEVDTEGEAPSGVDAPAFALPEEELAP